MKPNWFSLAAFAVVVAAIVGTHVAGVSQLTTMLLSVSLPVIPALLAPLFAKGDKP